jgi:hypothetical protein
MADENLSKELVEKDDEIDIRELILVLLRNWIIIVAATAVIALGVIIYANTLPDQYTTKTIAVSGGGGGGNQMAGLAALAGINVPAGGGGVNLMNYVDLLIQNTAFNQSIVEREWVIRRLQTKQEQEDRAPFVYDTMTLAQFWTSTNFWKLIEPDTTAPDWQHRWNMAQINTLRDGRNRFISIDIDPRKGTLEITTRFENPSLSYAVHQFLIEYLMEVIQEDRLNRGKESRMFIQERVSETRENLHRAEARLVNFRERNLTAQSPSVILEGERLGREVALQAALYTELVRQLEIARIDERRESPAFEIIKEADFPLGPSEPNRRLLYLIGLVGGCFAGVFFVFAKEWILSIINHKNA